MSTGIAANVGPYMYDGVSRCQLKFPIAHLSERRFTMLISGAFNAMGLIGSEYNGIVILDDDRMHVLLDRHLENPNGGYHGPSQTQLAEYDRIQKMDWQQFREFVNANSRKRYGL